MSERTTRKSQEQVAAHERARYKARSNSHARKLLAGQMRRAGRKSMLAGPFAR